MSEEKTEKTIEELKAELSIVKDKLHAAEHQAGIMFLVNVALRETLDKLGVKLEIPEMDAYTK